MASVIISRVIPGPLDRLGERTAPRRLRKLCNRIGRRSRPQEKIAVARLAEAQRPGKLIPDAELVAPAAAPLRD